MAGKYKKRHDEVRKRKRMSEVADLYVQGMTQQEISNVLEVSITTVNNDIDKLMEEWLEKCTRDFSKRQAEELAKINHLESIAWEAWEQSKDKITILKTKKEEIPRPRPKLLPDKLKGTQLEEEIEEELNRKRIEEEYERKRKASEPIKRKRGRPSKEDLKRRSLEKESNETTTSSNEKAAHSDDRPIDRNVAHLSGGNASTLPNGNAAHAARLSSNSTSLDSHSFSSERSKDDLITIRLTTDKQVVERNGDPRFLDRIAWCIETRMKVLGMFKPDVKVNQTTVHINWGDMHKDPSEIRKKITSKVSSIKDNELPKELPSSKGEIIDVDFVDEIESKILEMEKSKDVLSKEINTGITTTPNFNIESEDKEESEVKDE